jgi:hypothetical protein
VLKQPDKQELARSATIAQLFERGFKVFDPSTRFTAWPWTLARGPQQNQSRDDDFLRQRGYGSKSTMLGFLKGGSLTIVFPSGHDYA